MWAHVLTPAPDSGLTLTAPAPGLVTASHDGPGPGPASLRGQRPGCAEPGACIYIHMRTEQKLGHSDIFQLWTASASQGWGHSAGQTAQQTAQGLLLHILILSNKSQDARGLETDYLTTSNIYISTFPGPDERGMSELTTSDHPQFPDAKSIVLKGCIHCIGQEEC